MEEWPCQVSVTSPLVPSVEGVIAQAQPRSGQSHLLGRVFMTGAQPLAAGLAQ